MTSEQLNKQRIRAEIEQLQSEHLETQALIVAYEKITSDLIANSVRLISQLDIQEKRIEALEKTL